MKIKKQIEDKLFEYDENFLTGKEKLSINGEVLEKVDKHSHKSKDGKIYKVDGNFFSGVCIEHKKEKMVLYENTWFENVLILLPMILFVVGLFFGIIGGILGAVFAMLCMFVCASVFHSNLKVGIKVFVSIASLIIATGATVGLYLLIVSLI